MKKLSELSDETLLYVEVFNDLKSIVPDVKVVTKKEYVEYKINEVLMRHPNYIAGESVENDVWREKTNENRDR